ncbi:MAG TPA: EAL domain-containing response regulator [Rhodanobacteraceae bacterium]|nr:EAL domain-containing response regulator [Rhodanobacteraceae bacterium]
MAANPERLVESSQRAFLDQLAEQLQALLTRIHQQCRHGWDINVILRLHAQVAPLARACQKHGQEEIGEQLLAIDTALSPALIRMRLPDNGSTALIAALADHLRSLASKLRSEAPEPRADSVVALKTVAPPLRELRVLVASMRAAVARDIAASLSADGMQVRVLAEPLAALEELSRQMPHCVLVDRRTYLYDGHELAAMIHERPDFADVPVLFLDDGDADSDDPQLLPVTLQGPQWAQAVRARVEAARAAQPTRVELGSHRGHYRRAWLLDRLDAAIDHGKGKTGGLLDIGIDNVGELHQRLGMTTLVAIHDQLGKLLASLLDNGDMLAENGTGYLLLSRTRDADHLRALADELCVKVESERFGPSALPLRITIGGCAIGGAHDSSDAVLSAALQARQSMAEGGIGWHQPERDRIAPAQIEAALRHGRLHLVFQAIVGLAASPTPQYQALLRLRDDDGYVHGAGELISVAGEAALLPSLDCWVLDRALHVLSRYEEPRHPLRLFVNQSCESLRQRNYAQWLEGRLRAHGVRPERLVLTLGRADVDAAMRDIITLVPRLKALGVGLCLADVDRGADSARLLDTLPLDYIKLAPALASRPGAAVPIAHARNIRVIAPQIEDHTVIRDLRKAGVDCVQGHALAHPARGLNYRFDATAEAAS